MKKIVVIGSCNTDFVVSLPHLPAAGETILANGIEVCYGGKGANQAAAIAKLGGDVSMIGCVGDDAHGEALTTLLGEYGVDTSGILSAEGTPTGTAYIYVSAGGENSIVVNSGANKLASPEQVSQLEHLLAGADCCITQLEIPLPTVYYAAKLCRKLGVRFILNPAPAAKLDYEQLRGTWMIIPNESELNLLVPDEDSTSAKAHALLGLGFDNVLVTLGSQGGLLVNVGGETSYPAYTKLTAKDTTAAEFNIYVDAEAAHIVFSSGVPVIMNGLDITNTVQCTPEIIKRMEAADNNASLLFSGLMHFFLETSLRVFGFAGGPLHDPTCIAWLIDPTCIEHKEMFTEIELRSEKCYGRTLCDYFGVNGKPANSKVAVAIDQDKFWNIVEECIRLYN